MVSKSPVMETIEDIRAFAKKHTSNARGSHDWDHTERVLRLCMHIGRVEGADLEVLKIAAYLHDIGRSFQDASRGRVCHAEKGAQIAEEFLAHYPLSDARRKNIIHCIRSHRFRGTHPPETLEAKVLFDADKLDAIGAVGVARTFLFAGEVGARLHNPEVALCRTRPYTKDDTGYREFRLKLCKIKDRMLTREGRRMAEERHGFMETFFQRLTQEYEGIR
ncbi:MAG: HD domain-containing protein [Deltaproteobacteria bacterium]|nr:HD domain-containing protein [Deltaproteobacteria bacterium]